jgi:hypothetical protein
MFTLSKDAITKRSPLLVLIGVTAKDAINAMTGTITIGVTSSGGNITLWPSIADLKSDVDIEQLLPKGQWEHKVV